MSKYSRKIFLINPEFQLKFSFYISLLILISSLLYPITIYNLLSEIMVSMQKVNPRLFSNLSEKRGTLITVLVMWQLGFSALVFIVCIFFSHKIAGPMYKLQKFLLGKINGTEDGKLYFRKGDHFQEIAETVNNVFETIEEQKEEDLAYLNEVKTYINNLGLVVPEDKRAVLNEINVKISEIQERYKN